jgi:site-specific recombinase XerD
MTQKVILQIKNKGDEFGFLYILYSDKGNRKKVSLNHKMLEKHFNSKLFIKDLNNFNKTTLFDYKALNIKINNLINDTTIFDIKEDVVITSYLTYFQKYIDERLTKYTSKSAFGTSLKQFKIYLTSIGKDDIQFNELTSELLERYRVCLVEKGRTNTTIKTYFTAMKCVFNKAIDDNRIFISDKDIFRNIKKGLKSDIKVKRVLTDADISILKRIKRTEYKYENRLFYDGMLDDFGTRIELTNTQKETYKEVNNNVLFYVSRMFLFSLFSNGMRFSDMFLVRLENLTENTIEYTTLKNKKGMKILINVHINRVICDILGLENYHKRLKSERLKGYLDNELTYYNLQDLIKKEIKVKLDKTDTTLITYKGYSHIDVSNKELVKWIDRIYLMSLEIDRRANILLYNEIKKMNKKDFLFKKFLNTDIFNDFKKETGFTELQNKKYKTLMAKYDRQLTSIGKKYKLSHEKLSSHNARHSFTNIILTMDNINLLDVSKLLGHSNLSTTQAYISSGFEFEKHKEINDEFSKRFVSRY